MFKVVSIHLNKDVTKKSSEKSQTKSTNLHMDMGGIDIISHDVSWKWILKKLKESSLLPKPKA